MTNQPTETQTRELTRQAYAVFALADLQADDVRLLGESGIVTATELKAAEDACREAREANFAKASADRIANLEGVAKDLQIVIEKKNQDIADLIAANEMMQGQLQAMSDEKRAQEAPPKVDLVAVFGVCGLSNAIEVALDHLEIVKNPGQRRMLMNEVLNESYVNFCWIYGQEALTEPEFNALKEALQRGDQ